MQVRPLGWEDPLKKEMTTHSSILAWKIPWQRSLVGLKVEDVFKCSLGIWFSLFFTFKQLLFYIWVELIYNVVLFSSVQQSDSVIHIHESILLQITFPFRLLHNIEQSSLCNTTGLCCFSTFWSLQWRLCSCPIV